MIWVAIYFGIGLLLASIAIWAMLQGQWRISRYVVRLGLTVTIFWLPLLVTLGVYKLWSKVLDQLDYFVDDDDPSQYGV